MSKPVHTAILLTIYFSFLINRIAFSHLRFKFDLTQPLELLKNITNDLDRAFTAESNRNSLRPKSLKTEDDIVSIWGSDGFADLYSYKSLDGAAVCLTLLEMFLRIRNQLVGLLMSVPDKYDFNDEQLLHRSRRDVIDFLPHDTMTGAGTKYKAPFSGPFEVFENNHTTHQRSEREILGAVALGMSVWNSFRISNLENHLMNLSSKYNALIDSTNLLHAKHNQLAADVVLMKRMIEMIASQNYRKILATSMSAMDRIRDTVESVVSIVTSGRQRRVSPRLLSGDALAEAYITLIRKARDMNCELLLAHPTDIYNVQATYGYSQEGLVFEIVVHVPMAPKSEKLALVEYVPFPIAFQSRISNSTIIPDVGLDKYLAVLPLGQSSSSTATHKFRILNDIELQSCFVLRNHYLCSGRNSLRLDIASTCISSLWLKDHELIAKNCDLKIEAPREVVAKLSPRQWLIYSPTSITKSIVCGTSVIDSIRFERQTKLTLVEDCELNLERHYIATDVNILVDFEVKAHEWHYFGSVFSDIVNNKDNINEVIDEVMATKGKFGIQDLTHLKHYFEASSDVITQLWKAISNLNLFSIFGNVYTFFLYVAIIWFLFFAYRQGWLSKFLCPKKKKVEDRPILKPMRAPSIGFRAPDSIAVDLQRPPPYDVVAPSAPLLGQDVPQPVYPDLGQPKFSREGNGCLIKHQSPDHDPSSFVCHMHDPIQGCSGTFGQIVKQKSKKEKKNKSS